MRLGGHRHEKEPVFGVWVPIGRPPARKTVP